MKNVQFRVDGDDRIGYGHLVRCSALAAILESRFEVSFWTMSPANNFIKELADKFRVHHMGDESDFFNSIARENIVVLDGYHFDHAYQSEIRSLGAVLVFIDDLRKPDCSADVIINHAPQVTTEDYYWVKQGTRLALGPGYALLRPAFLKEAANSRSSGQNGSVLIIFGGSDYLNLAPQTLKVIMEHTLMSPITVATGYTDKNIGIHDMIDRSGMKVRVLRAAGEEELAEAMLHSDLAIVSSSSVLLETISCGCLPIMCYYADNQKDLHDYMHKEAGVRSFGDNSREFRKEALIEQIQNLDAKWNPELLDIRKQMCSSSENHIRLFNSL